MASSPRTIESRTFVLREFFAQLAERTDRAANALSSWGVTVPSGSRLAQASEVLRATASGGQVQATSTDVAPVLRAVWVAADFVDIAAFLPRDRVKSVREELTIALQGELWPPFGTRQPLQMQSQHWVTSLLLHRGLDIEYAVYSSRRQVKIPEFYLRNGTQRIAVEVKRPESERGIAAAVESANSKFHEHGTPGAIVLELTDCIAPAREEEFDAVATALMLTAHDTLWDAHCREFRPGFQKVIYLGGIFRGAWAVAADRESHLRLLGMAFHQGYSRHPKSLEGHRSEWLQREFNQAIDNLIARVTG